MSKGDANFAGSFEINELALRGIERFTRDSCGSVAVQRQHFHSLSPTP
jgi:hypothetical protein